ncbi:protein crumbs homolog 3a [Chanos chanos]|uniref:Protein crumbs homolog 3 n=1 Tax=Chanos chanos TaxID=29144 RepID=A0A6J2WPC1_CHACN|nr:protein crumbs homolog 3 [Chanos chanos]XP_030646519.1 protein crumbs homolog 3 [Chanos chanos]
MAVLLEMMSQSGLATGSVLLLTLWFALSQGQSTTPSSENTSTTVIGTTTNSPGLNIAAIVAPTVTVIVLAIIAGVLVFLFCVVKKKRQTEGTYRPSAEEQTGARGVEAPDALKLPKEERLI